MELIRKKELVVGVLDPEDEIFVVHIASLAISNINKMHLSCKAQIASLNVNKAPIITLPQYSDFASIFSSKLITKLSKYIRINNHAIDLVDVRQPSYAPIYSLGLVELKTSKT